jgi:hypothetical protein
VGHRLAKVAEAEDLHGGLEGAWPARVDLDPLAVGTLERRRDEALAAETLALAALDLDVREVVLLVPPVHRALRKRAVEQRHVDALATSGLASRAQRREHADRGDEPRAVANVRVPEEYGPVAAGAGLLGHHAELRGDEAVIAGLVPPGPMAPVRRQ